MAAKNDLQELEADYRKNYSRGWSTSARSSDGALERADGRNESDAWYDGYMDYATGREKWHLAFCVSHEPSHCPQA